jgi:hypothetical protein
VVEKDQSLRSGTQRRDSALLSGNFESREARIAIQLEAPLIRNARRALHYHLLTLIDFTIPSSEDDPFVSPNPRYRALVSFLADQPAFLTVKPYFFPPFKRDRRSLSVSPISGSFIGPCESVRAVFVAFWPLSAFNVRWQHSLFKGGLCQALQRILCKLLGISANLATLSAGKSWWVETYKLVLTSCRICSWKRHYLHL